MSSLTGAKVAKFLGGWVEKMVGCSNTEMMVSLSDDARFSVWMFSVEIVFHPQCSRLAWCKVLGNEGERGQSPNKTVLSVEQGEGCWCFTNVE